jgi:hypothetical protein
MAGACLSAERCSTGCEIGHRAPPDWTEIPEVQASCDRFEGQCRLRVALSRVFAHDDDLRRLRLKGLIHRIPNTHRYTATSYGLKVAFFNAKLYLRIFRPNWPALLAEGDPLPRSLLDALDGLDREIQKLHEEAALAA